MKKLIAISIVLVLTAVTTSVAYAAPALPSDDFYDNSRNTSMWNLYEDSHANAWLDQANHQLELHSTTDAIMSTAVYYSNGWGLSTASNFSFRVDFHNGSTSGPDFSGIEVELGFGKGIGDLERIKSNNISISASSYLDQNGSHPRFDYYKTTNDIEDDKQDTRNENDGILYISYDASLNSLYLSTTSYGSANSFWTLENILQGEWNCTAVSPFLGGWADKRELTSGDAFLDNFVVDSGTVVYIPEPATICLLSLGALSLLRRKK